MAQTQKPKISRRAELLVKRAGLSWDRSQAADWGEEDVLDEAQLFHTYLARQLLLTDLANLRDDEAGVVAFWRRKNRNIRPVEASDLFGVRDALSLIWRNPNSTDTDLILDNWLRWLPSPAHLEAWEGLRWAKRGATEPKDYIPFICSFRAGKLVPDLNSLRAMLIQGVFENWRHFKYCANPECLAPYFIAKRKDQTVCDAEICKAEKQREYALQWWKENRSKQALLAKSVPVKSGKKGKATNVAKKAR